MTKFRFIYLVIIMVLFSECSVQINQSNSNTESPKTENINTTKVEPSKEIQSNIEDNSPTPTKPEIVNKTNCNNLIHDDLLIDKKQTFAIDFKPFEKSCFATFHDPEFDNPPLGSQFFIYKNGKEVFEFPDQFGGANTTCWVNGVAFEDLNNDQLKDIIVVGKCGEKSGSYNENMVYINTGEGFETNIESNAETMDFSKIDQIKDYVKKNPKMFIP